MKALLATAAAGLLLVGVQQYRIRGLQLEATQCNAAVEQQNHATETLATAGTMDSSAAAARATDVLLAGERQKANQPKGAGPKVMNEFMKGLFQ